MSLSPNFLVLSSLKVSEDGESLVARFYNPTAEAVQARVEFGHPVREVRRCDAAENTLEQLSTQGKPQQCELEIGPAEIVSLSVTP